MPFLVCVTKFKSFIYAQAKIDVSGNDTVLDASCSLSLKKMFFLFFACYTLCFVNFFLEKFVSRTNHIHLQLCVRLYLHSVHMMFSELLS